MRFLECFLGMFFFFFRHLGSGQRVVDKQTNCFVYSLHFFYLIFSGSVKSVNKVSVTKVCRVCKPCCHTAMLRTRRSSLYWHPLLPSLSCMFTLILILGVRSSLSSAETCTASNAKDGLGERPPTDYFLLGVAILIGNPNLFFVFSGH